MPLGPMLDALLALAVPPSRDMQVSEDLFMDLDAPPLKRSRDTPSSTQPSDFANSNDFVQRAQPPVFRCPELLSQWFLLQKHLFSQCHMETLHP